MMRFEFWLEFSEVHVYNILRVLIIFQKPKGGNDDEKERVFSHWCFSCFSFGDYIFTREIRQSLGHKKNVSLYISGPTRELSLKSCKSLKVIVWCGLIGQERKMSRLYSGRARNA